MFTPKEINILNFLKRKFKNKRPTIEDAYVYLKNTVSSKTVNQPFLLEMSSLFFFNWTPTGDFKSIQNPIRIEPNVYLNLKPEIILLSAYLEDFDYRKYWTLPGSDGVVVIYKGKNYYVFDGLHKMTKFLGEIGACEIEDVVKDYVTMYSEVREEFANEIALEEVNNMGDEEVIIKTGVDDKIIEIEKKIEFEENRIEKRNNILLTVEERLDVAERESDDETIKKLQNKIFELDKEISDIESTINGYFDDTEDIILDARRVLVTNLENTYNNMISENVVDFFVNYKKKYTFEELIKNRNWVEVYCTEALKKYCNDLNRVKEGLNLKNLEEIEYNDKNYVIMS